MKESKQLKIKFKSGILTENKVKGQEYKEYEYDYVTVSTSHVKRYNNAIMLLMGITGCELHLIEWLADNMTEGNYVSNNELTRRSFIQFHEKHKRSGNKSYSDHSVQKAFQVLAGTKMILPVVKGVYLVNPEYYFKGEDVDRIKSIKLIMEFRSGVATGITREVDSK